MRDARPYFPEPRLGALCGHFSDVENLCAIGKRGFTVKPEYTVRRFIAL